MASLMKHRNGMTLIQIVNMNERIKELADEAREYATTRHPVSNITLSVNSDLFEQKFAELIVQKCADYITEYYPHSRYEAFYMKKHFGVEEQVTEPNELHTCPYKEELHNDYETMCDCDEEQQRQCAMDI